MNPLQQHLAILRLRRKGKSKSDRRRDQHDGEHIAGNKRRQHIIRNNREEVIVVGQPLQFTRNIRCARPDDLCRQIRGCEPDKEREPHRRRTDRREQRIGDGMGEDPTRVALRPERRECRDHSECDGRHGNELEQPREYRRNKVKQFIQYRHIRPAKHSADDERTDPEHNLPLLIVQLCGRERRLCLLLHLVVCRHGILLICHI